MRAIVSGARSGDGQRQSPNILWEGLQQELGELGIIGLLLVADPEQEQGKAGSDCPFCGQPRTGVDPGGREQEQGEIGSDSVFVGIP